MGINGSATCVLNFGENGDCIGELVGGDAKQNQGMSQMFQHDELARASPSACRACAVASSAYLNALDYANERKQGASIKPWKDADGAARADHRARRRAPHAARHEGARRGHPRARGQADASPRSARVARGQGRRRRSPTTRARSICWCRWSRRTAPIRRSGSARPRSRPTAAPASRATTRSSSTAATRRSSRIYEGTNHIQAMDLVGRKLVQGGGANLQAFGDDVGKFVAKHGEHADARRRRQAARRGAGGADRARR